MSDSPTQTRPVVWLLLSLVLALATCLVGDAAWLCHENTLCANGRWTSSKLGLGRYTLGALSYMVTTTALHDNRLNLGVWHGCHEILYRQPLQLASAGYDCHLADNTYACFIFDKQADGSRGVRLSVNPEYPSIYFEATPQGRFTRQEPLLGVAVHRGWNHVALSFEDGLSVTVNRILLPVLRVSATRVGLCGFRGCLGDTAVDNVRLVPVGSAPVVETFDNFADLPGLLLRTFPVAAAAVGGLFAILWWGLHNPRTGPFTVTLTLWLLIVSGLAFGVQWFYLGPMHPKHIDFGRYAEYRNYVEKAPDDAAVCNDILARYKGPSHGHRLIFVGSSQTWGSGAMVDDDTWVRVVERRLNAERGAYECINAGISGETSGNLDTIYKNFWLPLKPEVCVIDLGFNDPSPTDLTAHLLDMIENNRTRNIQTLVILEPANTDYHDNGLLSRRQAMIAMCEHAHVPYVRMQEALDAHARDGFLWWDMVHLTSFGQQVFADALYPELVRLVPGQQ